MTVSPARGAGVDTEEVRIGTYDKREDAEEEAAPDRERERDGQGKTRRGSVGRPSPQPGPWQRVLGHDLAGCLSRCGDGRAPRSGALGQAPADQDSGTADGEGYEDENEERQAARWFASQRVWVGRAA